MPYDEDGNWSNDTGINALGPRWRLFATVSIVVISVAFIIVLIFWIASGRGL